jgi:hypothetical protein
VDIVSLIRMARAEPRGSAAAHDIMMTISDPIGIALPRIEPDLPQRERTDPECRKNAEKSHTRLLVARRHAAMETF